MKAKELAALLLTNPEREIFFNDEGDIAKVADAVDGVVITVAILDRDTAEFTPYYKAAMSEEAIAGLDEDIKGFDPHIINLNYDAMAEDMKTRGENILEIFGTREEHLAMFEKEHREKVENLRRAREAEPVWVLRFSVE